MDGIETEKKKITLSFVVHYFFGAFFLLFGVIEIAITNFISGLFFILAGVVIIPPAMKYVEDKYNFSTSSAAKFFIVFCFMIGAVAAVPTQTTDSNEAIASAPSDVSGAEKIEATDEKAQNPGSPEGSIYVVGTNYKCGSWSDEQYPLIRLFGDNYVPFTPE